MLDIVKRVPPVIGRLVAEAGVDEVRAGAAPRVKRAPPPAGGRVLLAKPVGPPGEGRLAAPRVKRWNPPESGRLVAEADVDDIRAGAAPRGPRVKRAPRPPAAHGRALLARPVGPPADGGALLAEQARFPPGAPGK